MIEGFYYDPQHGGCLRKIVLYAQNKYKIIGAYGNDEPNTGSKWHVIATKTRRKNMYYVDFSSKKFVTHGPYTVTWNPKPELYIGKMETHGFKCIIGIIKNILI